MPIITISRLFGAGGSEVAGRTAAALGWTLLDNALVERVADRLGVTAEDVAARQERIPPLAERLAETLALAAPEFAAPYAESSLPPFEERMLDVTRRVIEEAAERGPVVIVGRGAQSTLARREDALHVLCYAPREALVERAARRMNASLEEAARVVDDTNRHREQYVKRHWGRSWTAHENYHLCVNTAWLGVEGAADAVVDVARRRFGA